MREEGVLIEVYKFMSGINKLDGQSPGISEPNTKAIGLR